MAPALLKGGKVTKQPPAPAPVQQQSDAQKIRQFMAGYRKFIEQHAVKDHRMPVALPAPRADERRARETAMRVEHRTNR